MHKAGKWRLTSVGRHALSSLGTPQAIYQQVDRIYHYWEENRQGFDLLERLVDAILEGSWVSGRDLADLTDLEQERLVQWLQGVRPTGWHRVLDSGGHLPAEAHAGDEDRERWLSLLSEDGINTAQGRADGLQHLPGTDLKQLVEPLNGDGDAPRRAWLVRGSWVQGENLIKTLWLPEGICSLPASHLRDLPAGMPAERVRAAIDNDYGHASAQDRARLAGEYHAFLSRMHENDVVVTNDGSDFYFGVVTGAPSFVASMEQRANLQRTVDWRRAADDPVDYADEGIPDEFSARIGNPDAELIEVTEFLADFERLIDKKPAIVEREMRLPDVTEKFADELLVGRGWLQECVELLRERPQLIFYGPPGTGKTWIAQHLADYLVGNKPENVQLVQFHPAYSYEDFFEGYRPQKTDDGTVAFDLVRGPLRRLAAAAHGHQGEPYVLIIDEINRGNLAKIFGELYFLLEYRKRSVNLLYGSDEGKGFTLPRNLVVLGTMNTADRSIALVDAAMRRRFWFVELHPDEPPTSEILTRWLKDQGTDEPARLLAELNRRIDDRDFRIGPSYLMKDSALSDEGLERIWRRQILPLLEEHHYGDGTDVQKRYGLDALRAHLG